MELKFVIESILFSSQKPLTPAELRDLLKKAAEFEDAPEARDFKKTNLDTIESALSELWHRYLSEPCMGPCSLLRSDFAVFLGNPS
jgi:chromosome segregation and condensation protein ScpB